MVDNDRRQAQLAEFMAQREQVHRDEIHTAEVANVQWQALMQKHAAMLSNTERDFISLNASHAEVDDLSRLSPQTAAARMEEFLADELATKDLSASELRASTDAFSRVHTVAATLNIQRTGTVDDLQLEIMRGRHKISSGSCTIRVKLWISAISRETISSTIPSVRQGPVKLHYRRCRKFTTGNPPEQHGPLVRDLCRRRATHPRMKRPQAVKSRTGTKTECQL
jgi:hypothetical protein